MSGGRRRRLLVLLLAAACLTLGVAACGSDDGDEAAATATDTGATATEGTETEATETLDPADADTTIQAGMGGEGGEYTFDLESTSAPAGVIAFDITNNGQLEHEFEVVKTDQAPEDLEVKGEQADPEFGGGEEIGEIEDMQSGDAETLTLELEAGKYVILCNLPGHYEQGMVTAFTVN